MVSGFAVGSGAVVARRASTVYVRVVYPCHRVPSGRGVAVPAIIIGIDMSSGFARSRRTVMASGAGGGDTAVIKDRSSPGRSIVA